MAEDRTDARISESLVEEARPHQRVQLSEEAHGPNVFVCSEGDGRWPCLTRRLADRVEELEVTLRVIGYDERRGWHGMDSMREFARQALSPPMDAGRERE